MLWKYILHHRILHHRYGIPNSVNNNPKTWYLAYSLCDQLKKAAEEHKKYHARQYLFVGKTVGIVHDQERNSGKKQDRENICTKSHDAKAYGTDGISYDPSHTKCTDHQDQAGRKHHKDQDLCLKAITDRLLLRRRFSFFFFFVVFEAAIVRLLPVDIKYNSLPE